MMKINVDKTCNLCYNNTTWGIMSIELIRTSEELIKSYENYLEVAPKHRNASLWLARIKYLRKDVVYEKEKLRRRNVLKGNGVL